MSVMAPQYIWFWVFDGVPAFTIAAGTVLAIFLLQAATQKLDFSIYKYKQNLLLAVFWIMFNLSDLFSPIGSFRTATSSELVLHNFNIIVLMYFVSLPLINTEKALRVLALLFAGLILYYVYWSNDQYFSWNMRQFSWGRLMGPFHSPYQDENKFSMLFVTGMPFLLFGVFYFRSLLLRGLFGLGLLFLWHSIILTGSRGALVAVGVATILSYFLIKSRAFGFLLIFGLVAAVIYQGGQLLTRTTDTIDVANTQTEEENIDPRIQSWEVGIGIIKKHPILGVGVQRFQEATRVYYPGVVPYVAHNTFLNFAANTGLINGIIYLAFYWLQYKRFRRIRKTEVDPHSTMSYLNNSIMIAFTGFYTGSMFLDLIIYEPFYFLLLTGLLMEHLYNKKETESEVNVKAEQTSLKSNQPSY
jgi:O-antigen ligase